MEAGSDTRDVAAGASFTVRLPLVGERAAGGDARERPAALEVPDLAGVRVLAVVDDETERSGG